MIDSKWGTMQRSDTKAFKPETLTRQRNWNKRVHKHKSIIHFFLMDYVLDNFQTWKYNVKYSTIHIHFFWIMSTGFGKTDITIALVHSRSWVLMTL